MNPDIKAQWTSALRSGDYEQGYNGYLNKGNEFCCLGVLCDLAVKAGVCAASQDEFQPEIIIYGGSSALLPPVVRGSSALLPSVVRAWAEINLDETDSGTVNVPGTERSLAYFNDRLRYSFEQIADLIEEKF